MALQLQNINPLKSQKAARWTLLVITWVAFLLRTLKLDGQSLWRDEVDSIFFASWELKYVVKALTAQGHNGPLYYLLLHPWNKVAGTSEFSIRYPSVLMGTLAVPLGYVVARQTGLSRRAGLLLSLLMATSPYLVWYGQEARMYTTLLVVVMLAAVAYLKALAGNQIKWWVIFVIAASTSFYLHILSPLMLLVYIAIAIIFGTNLRRHWRRWVISMACLTLPYLPMVVWQFPLIWNDFNSGHPFYPLRQEIYLLLQLYSSGILRFVGLTAIVLFVFLFLAGLFLSNHRTKAEKLNTKRRLLLAAWALIPPLAIYLVSLRVPVFEDRYVIYITPAFYLIVVMGIISIRHHSGTLAGLCLGLILMINLMGIWQQQQRPLKPDFRAAAQYLRSQTQHPPTIMIQMPYLERTFNYYYPRKYTFLEGVWTNDGKSKVDVHNEMARHTAQLSTLWLVVSEERQWDERQLVRNWLNDNATLVNQAHFMRVELYHYQFRPGTIKSQDISLD